MGEELVLNQGERGRGEESRGGGQKEMMAEERGTGQ